MNYSLEDIMKDISIIKYRNQFECDFNDHEYEYQREYRRMEVEWKEKLDNIDIKYIEKYLRKKKLEKLEKINQ